MSDRQPVSQVQPVAWTGFMLALIVGLIIELILEKAGQSRHETH